VTELGDMHVDKMSDRELRLEVKRLRAESAMSGMLLALLDRIEIEQDHSLARQRFDIARELGYTVEFGERISGEKH